MRRWGDDAPGPTTHELAVMLALAIAGTAVVLVVGGFLR